MKRQGRKILQSATERGNIKRLIENYKAYYNLVRPRNFLDNKDVKMKEVIDSLRFFTEKYVVGSDYKDTSN